MSTHLIPVAFAAIGLIVALVSRRAIIAVPAALVTALIGIALTVGFVSYGLWLPAIVPAAGTVGAIAIAASHRTGDDRPIRRAPGKCPGWCEVQHRPPLKWQSVVSHERVTGGVDLDDGGIIEVRIGWMERLTGPASEQPVVVVSIIRERSDEIELTPAEAALLATMLAADLSGGLAHAYRLAIGDKAGWLPMALAEAAAYLGYRPVMVAGGMVAGGAA